MGTRYTVVTAVQPTTVYTVVGAWFSGTKHTGSSHSSKNCVVCTHYTRSSSRSSSNHCVAAGLGRLSGDCCCGCCRCGGCCCCFCYSLHHFSTDDPSCQSSAAICNLSIVVAFGHNELWRPNAANSISVTSQMLRLRPQRTVASEGRKSGYYVG